MTVLVQMSVKVSDTARFVATAEKYASMMAEMGAERGGVFEDQNEPGLMTLMSEWESHDAMHAASEKVGGSFNAEAGTEGLEWVTNIWERKGDA
jgi:quinol monooxygenase YgiN